MNNSSKMHKHVCVLCGERKSEGIFIHSGFICDYCETEIVKTDVTDEKYNFIIQRMKSLWLKNA